MEIFDQKILKNILDIFKLNILLKMERYSMSIF